MSKEIVKQETGALEVQRPPETIYQVLGNLARDPSVDVKRISELMDIQIKAEERQAEKEFNAAFARLQPRLPRIVKKGKIEMGSKGAIAFAKIEDIDAVIRPMYIAEGFSLSFLSEPCATGIIRVGVLRHKDGHSQTSKMQLPGDTGPGRNNLQALGSSMHYADRYLTCGLFNIITVGADDDGNAGSMITQNQADNINDLIRECGLTPASQSKFLEFMGIEAVSEIQQGGYNAAINYLVAVRRRIGEKAK